MIAVYHLCRFSRILRFIEAFTQIQVNRVNESVLRHLHSCPKQHPHQVCLFLYTQIQKSGDHKKENLALNVFSVPLSGCFISSSEMHGE